MRAAQQDVLRAGLDAQRAEAAARKAKEVADDHAWAAELQKQAAAARRQQLEQRVKNAAAVADLKVSFTNTFQNKLGSCAAAEPNTQADAARRQQLEQRLKNAATVADPKVSYATWKEPSHGYSNGGPEAERDETN